MSKLRRIVGVRVPDHTPVEGIARGFILDLLEEGERERERCPVCGRFIRVLDRLEAEASDWRVKPKDRHHHQPGSHTPEEVSE